MEIKFIKIYLSGAKRINELFEQNEQKAAKIREMEKATKCQDRQLRGYGKDFEALLRQIEEHKAERENLVQQIKLLKTMYMESEMARKRLGEKLASATELLEAAEKREEEREAVRCACPLRGEDEETEGGEAK